MSVYSMYNFDPIENPKRCKLMGSVPLGPNIVRQPDLLDKWIRFALDNSLPLTFGVEPMHSPKDVEDAQRIIYYDQRCRELEKALRHYDAMLTAVIVDDERKAASEEEVQKRADLHEYFHRMFKHYFDCPVYQYLWAPFFNPAKQAVEPHRWWRGDETRDAVTPVLYWPQSPVDMAKALYIAQEYSIKSNLPLVPWVSFGSGYVWSTNTGFDTPFKKELEYDTTHDRMLASLLRGLDIIAWPSPGDPNAKLIEAHLKVFLEAAQ